LLEDDARLGANSIVLGGAIIGEGAMIGAESVVRGRIPPYSVCIGNPAIVNKCRFDRDRLKILLIACRSQYSLEMILNEYDKNEHKNLFR